VRLVTFGVASAVGAHDRVGALVGDHVVDLADAHARMVAARPFGRRGGPALPATLLELLRWEDAGLEAARDAIDFATAEDVAHVPGDEVALRAPLPRPHSIRDFMLFEEHVLNMGGEVPEEWWRLPVHWKGNPDTVIGPDDEVPWPAYTEKLDYELELCAVIGRHGRPTTEDEAEAFIAGYSILNDWSARDIQLREMSVGLGPGLGKDFAISIGPCLATPDELDLSTARMRARVNGELWSEGSPGAMRFSFAQAICHLAQAQDLWPGDVLGSGTVGRGCGMELDRWLAPGDEVELEVEGLGVLRNRVAASVKQPQES
jgi:2-keto-4-pentenoate hydratase/2-oxohepta-3-ene-1,7-dioic acid hydratase in catechol pathway